MSTELPIPTLEEFQTWPVERVAECVRRAGPQVCVFPINGTRRWFVLEHPAEAAQDFVANYLRIGGRRHVELYRLFFDHGVDTLLTPVFGAELLGRGDEYMQIAAKGLLWFAEGQDFLDFYDAYDVRVRVYGDARRTFAATPYAYLLDAFNELARRTADHRRYRLFFGVCANDPTETVAEIGARFYRQRGRLPTRREIVAAYYGEVVEPVSFFIGFDRPSAFDMPLLALGEEDLYFTVSPSPYLDQATLRAILYDHLYTRRVRDADYEELSPEDWQTLAEFYRLNRRHVLGLGRQHASGGFWYPLPQVTLPPQMEGDGS